MLPAFVVGFYGGMLIMASLIYSLLERWPCCSCGPLIRYVVDKRVHDTFACEGESGDRLSAFSAGYVDERRFLLTLARFIANSLACAPILSFLRMPDGSDFTRKNVPGVRLEEGAGGAEL